MSQYGAPPPSGEPGQPGQPGDGDRTRVPGGGTPSGEPAPAWERPTRGPSEPDPWDQPAPQTTQQQPAQEPSYQQPAQPSYQQPYQQQPPQQQGWDGPQQASYDQGYAQPYQQGYERSAGQAGPWSTSSSGGGAAAAEAKGLVGALLDFSFSTFVTGRIVKVVYVLAIVGLALGLLGWLASAIATGSPLFIVFALVAGPIGFVVYLCFVRMTLELFLAITRMSEDIRERMPDARDRT
ncbi:DUF4282 domain-containing protein [uncultured Nocardioides sp.]|uniref:DUF4282 domain-containing protein n=1 Tax=uncultured Nocardioides sp. TaxID=198441 RepID=UPI002617A6C6|nr:DUF4282 domain-containing protein [uncultured Nocardioides sp.]